MSTNNSNSLGSAVTMYLPCDQQCVQILLKSSMYLSILTPQISEKSPVSFFPPSISTKENAIIIMIKTKKEIY